MAEIDTGLVGAVINAVPLNKMIATPLKAMIDAQIMASKGYADFIMGVCIEDGKAKSIAFEYDETLVDSEGKVQGVQSKIMKIPLLAAVSHPNIAIEEGTIDFSLTINQSVETKTTSDVEGGFNAKMGWGPFSVEVHGSVSHHAEQTRKTDTSAKYSIHTSIKRQDPPEGIMKVIDYLTNAATKPVQLPDATPADASTVKDDALPMPDADNKE